MAESLGDDGEAVAATVGIHGGHLPGTDNFESRKVVIHSTSNYHDNNLFTIPADISGDNILNDNVASGDAYDHSCASPNGMSDTDYMVEELIVKKDDDSDLAIIGTSCIQERLPARQNQSQVVYQLSDNVIPSDLGHVMATISDDLVLGPGASFTGHRKPNLQLIAAENNDVFEDIQSNATSKSGFWDSFSERKRKMEGFEGLMDAPSRIQQRDKMNMRFDHGVNLREWLDTVKHKTSTLECLHVFKNIVEFVGISHSKDLVLCNLRPSYFEFLSPSKIRYLGSVMNQDLSCLDDDHAIKSLKSETFSLVGKFCKKQKLKKVNFIKQQPLLTKEYSHELGAFHDDGAHPSDDQQQSSGRCVEHEFYSSPEELGNGICTISSNIYSLGVLLLELLIHCDSERANDIALSDLRNRILPSDFQLENPRESELCLLLLHPEPSSRPSSREILQSELISGLQELSSRESPSSIIDQYDAEADLLLSFLISMKEHKQNHTSKLVEDIKSLEMDIKELEKHSSMKYSLNHSVLCESWLMGHIDRLESAYFSSRSKFEMPKADQNQLLASVGEGDQRTFFTSFCKYAHYKKFNARGRLRMGDFSNTRNVICSLTFSRDLDFFAAAGVSKKIKIFEFNAFFNDSLDIHYPVAEMVNKSKLSCLSWNKYIRNYLSSTDYNGVVTVWDVSIGRELLQYNEHKKRAWSIDFSQLYPTKFASGSDDYSVKLWSIHEKSSLDTIKSLANVCCVQFSPYSSHLLAFGSADYKTYCYDLRNVRAPWCVLPGHSKAVSYVKFLDSETLVTASTDNSLRTWDLNKTTCSGLSAPACLLSLTGHTNEKNFVGLSVANGYIACGSETNEVYAYYRSLPVPITSYKFHSADPFYGKLTDNVDGQFVSCVCWRGTSDMLVAANSGGSIDVLQIV